MIACVVAIAFAAGWMLGRAQERNRCLRVVSKGYKRRNDYRGEEL